MHEMLMEPLAYQRRTEAEMQAAAAAFHRAMGTRRTVRHFAPDPVPRELIATCIQTAVTAPSGANLQPWHFVAVGDPVMKTRIREAGEKEERAFYASRAPEAWKNVLRPLGTDAIKPYLETAPWLIAIFAVNSFESDDGSVQPTYYPKESVGIATGLLITALHQAGLVTLTHTPSPMNFLNTLLNRPPSEKPFLLLIVGYPEAGVQVPALPRKPFDAVATFV